MRKGTLVSFMASKKSNLLGAMALAGLLALGSKASAQSIEDWPAFKGQNSRVGVNGDSMNSGPGQTNLRWWTPNGSASQYTQGLVIDNSDIAPFNYGVNANGYLTTSPASPSVYAWQPSPTASGSLTSADASSPWLEYDPANVSNERSPSYLYSKAVPATLTDPTAASSGTLATATYTITPSTGIAGTYALYVWVPYGPQKLNGVSIPQANYFVVQVQVGTKKLTEIVPASAGQGWIRLGNAGFDTSWNDDTKSPRQVFQYDPASTLTVTIFNTIPYLPNGSLSTKNNAAVVYADAVMAIPQNGYYDASPVSAQLTSGLAGTTQTIAALNQLTTSGISTVATGTVTAYQYNTGKANWNYTPVLSGSIPDTIDNTTASVTGGFAQDTTATRFSGAYASVATVNTASATDSVTYQPNLANDTYQIYAYLPGNNNGEQYGTQIQYQIIEGTTVSTVTVDQSVASGWIKIGTRRYTNNSTYPLKVVVTNLGGSFDGGLKVYANAMRFVGSTSQTITSTPVIATVGIRHPDNSIVATQVTVVADDSGTLHCLDAKGNGDGTTTEYWSYPSQLDTNGNDPNQVSTLDLNAEKLQAFNMSSALVQTINGKDYLYIGNANGRVYCIDMAGRGDYGSATRTVGTTTRVWTYPSTGPSSNAIAASKLGTFTGSVVYGVGANNQPTIYVPASQGRIYALDAVGNTDLSTNVVWAYPSINQPTLAPIVSTPALAFGRLYFGTKQNLKTETGGVFYALNIPTTAGNSPTLAWSFAADAANNVSVGDFRSSPAAVPFSALSVAGSTTEGLVYVSNENNYVYCFYSAPQAAGSSQVAWSSNELNVSSATSLSFTWQSVYDNTGVFNNYATIMVPTEDGRFVGLFADPAFTNQFGTRRAYEFYTASSNTKSALAISNQWMYGADESGFLYAFNNQKGYLSDGTPPGTQTVVENNPAGAIFRHAKMKLITRDGYNKLRQPTGSNLDYYTATGAAYSFNRSPLAFEWGEHVYILVYDFPFLTSNGTSTVAPPTVNITFSSQGHTLPAVPVMARMFKEPPNAPDDLSDPNYPSGTERDNGYAIIEYAISSGQNQQMVPGPGTISFTIASGAMNSNGLVQNIALNPSMSNFSYLVANPLALAMPDSNGNYTDSVSIGMSLSPSNAENLVNGNPKLPGTTKLENLLGQATPVANHGNSQTAPVLVFDRSMVAENSGDNLGLANVMVDIQNLAWQGGHLAIYKPLPQPYYSNFEDYPDNYPNDSFDYPDIQNQQVSVVKDPNGSAENPRFGGVTLIPPLVKDAGSGPLRQMQLGDDPSWRVFQPTPFNLTVNVPRFQPPNSSAQVSSAGALVTNSAGVALNQGYMGRARVLVGAGQNGVIDQSSTDSYRSFNFSTSVDVDEKLTVTTPTVDLGTLAMGTGYDPLAPGSNYNSSSSGSNSSSVFQPWDGYYKSIFQPFSVQNIGNVNLLNLRVAKGANLPVSGSSPIYNPWGFYSNTNDLLGFLDGTFNLHSSMDATFAPEGGGPNRPVALQKPRVSDVSGTSLSVNPIRRVNTNLGVTGTVTLGGSTYLDVLNQTLSGSGLKYPPGPPTVAVSIPFGMPVGSYSNTVQVIEKNSNDEIWEMFNGGPESAANPAFTLNFKVREAQITGNFTKNTSPMVDNGSIVPSAAAPLAYSNRQPTMVRDSFGSMVMAWASDRPNWNPAQPATTDQLGNFSLFVATVGNGSTFSSTGVSGVPDPLSPLSDLNNFQPASNQQWFNRAIANYPAVSADLLFGSQSGESVVAGTVQYGNPTFPQMGVKNPYNTSQTFNGMFMAFSGDAQKQTPSGKFNESKLFMSILTLAGGGTVSVTPTPVVLSADPQVEKGKPSVLQTVNGAMVFYPGVSGGQSNIYYSVYGTGSSGAPAFTNPVSLPFGRGFQWVSSPSASGRIYSGRGENWQVGTGVQQLANGDPLVDLTFVGQLRGRPTPEVFYGRMKADRNALVLVDDNGTGVHTGNSDGNIFLDLVPISNEPVTAAGQPGLYRSLGVMWERTGRIQLLQVLNGVTTDLLIANTATFDQQSGMISSDSRLGGKVYFDTTLGTIKFSGSTPSANATLLLSYVPRFLRVSMNGGQSYAKATGLYDAREASNISYWRQHGGGLATYADDIRNSRYVFTYNRAASGNGLAPRPYLTTVRLGVQLPTRVACDNTGTPLNVSVTGNLGPYQIDPANGRVYFTDIDEDSNVTVNYTALLENASVVPGYSSGLASVSLIREQNEQQILIDNAVNEADLAAFLDPFSFINQRRPPLIWLLWSSNRSGISDIYMESISPQWSPVSVSQ